MQLITEVTAPEDAVLSVIAESNGDGSKSFTIEGVFMQADVINRNGREYPKAHLEVAVDKYINQYVNKARALGELNHPDGPTINLDKVSHRITELNWKGSDVIGKAKILNTPMGQIVAGLLEGGCSLGVSSRGMGTVVKKGGKSIINNDFILSTVDIVQDPSAPAAFVNGILEGKEWFMEGSGQLIERCDGIKKVINKMSADELVEKQGALFEEFLQTL